MNKFVLAFTSALFLVVGGAEAAEHLVTGKTVNDVDRWEYNGVLSAPAKVGDPANRLTVRVRPGDTVVFKAMPRGHGVILENALSEQADGVWEVTAGPGTLGEVAMLPDYYNLKDARGTERITGDVITIRIKEGLTPGKTILFACNPHSKKATNTNVDMLGKIVLGEKERSATEAEKDVAAFAKMPEAKSCRRIDFESAEVRPGIVNGTWILIVRGTGPCANMRVELIPLVYVRQPEYWEIEVVGCLRGGICLPVQTPFTETLPLQGVTGTKGIKVVGATKMKVIDIPPSEKKE